MTQIELIPVEGSSNIEAIGYDPRSQTLVVQFKGSLYNYLEVPARVWDSFRIADSKGKFHAQFIRRTYKYEKVM